MLVPEGKTKSSVRKRMPKMKPPMLRYRLERKGSMRFRREDKENENLSLSQQSYGTGMPGVCSTCEFLSRLDGKSALFNLN